MQYWSTHPSGFALRNCASLLHTNLGSWLITITNNLPFFFTSRGACALGEAVWPQIPTEFGTLLTQIEACLNSRPLIFLPNDDGVEELTHPKSFPHYMNPSGIGWSSILKCWHLSQALLCQFWRRWSVKYLANLKRYNKWHYPIQNICVGDVVIQLPQEMSGSLRHTLGKTA